MRYILLENHLRVLQLHKFNRACVETQLTKNLRITFFKNCHVFFNKNIIKKKKRALRYIFSYIDALSNR